MSSTTGRIGGAIAGALALLALASSGADAAREPINARDDNLRAVPGMRLVIKIHGADGILGNDDKGGAERLRLKDVFLAPGKRSRGILSFRVNRAGNKIIVRFVPGFTGKTRLKYEISSVGFRNVQLSRGNINIRVRCPVASCS